MPTPKTPQSSRAPRQDRSRATLERVLASAEQLLDERLFDAISMADIARHAGVSVGVIYTRFSSKEALLPALFERHNAAVTGRMQSLFESLGREPLLHPRIRLVVDFAIDYNRRHFGLLRALTVHVRSHPESVPAQVFGERAGQYRAVAEAVLGDVGAVPGPRPLESMEFLLTVVHSVCRDEILFGDVAPLREHRRGVRALRNRLVHLVHSAITTTPE